MKRTVRFVMVVSVVTSLLAGSAGSAAAQANPEEDPTAPVSEEISNICSWLEGGCGTETIAPERELPTDGTELGQALVLEHGLLQESFSESAWRCSSQTCMYANGEGRYVKYVMGYGYTGSAGCAYAYIDFTGKSGKTSFVSASNYVCYKSGGTFLFSYHAINKTFKEDGKLCFRWVALKGTAPSGKPCVNVYRR